MGVQTIEEIPLELLVLLQSANAEISGRRVWPGSVLLSLFLASSHCPVTVSGATVLELGAGSGLAGIVASRLGASNVVVTDGDETSIKLAAKNLANNHLD